MKLGEWTIITKEIYEAALMSGLAQYIYKSGFYIPTQMSKESAYFYQKWNNAYFKSWQPYKKNRSEIIHEAMAFDNDFYTVQPNNGSFSVECHPVTPNLCFITDDQNYRQAYYYRRHEIEQTATDPIEYEDREGKLICACGKNRIELRVLLEAKERLNVGTVDPANILADCNMSKLFKQGAFSIFNPDDYVSYVFQFADALKLTPNKTQRVFKSAWGCKSEDLEQHILNSKKKNALNCTSTIETPAYLQHYPLHPVFFVAMVAIFHILYSTKRTQLARCSSTRTKTGILCRNSSPQMFGMSWRLSLIQAMLG